MRTLKSYLEDVNSLEISTNDDVIDDVILVVDNKDPLFNELDKKIKRLDEYANYRKLGNTKCYYRLDKGNNTVGQERHIHVFTDERGRHQLYAINYDGTKHDGSKYQLNKKHIEALKKLGIIPPENGLLEWKSFTGKQLLLD